MKGILTFTAFAAGARALVARGDSCCFHLDGASSGPVGQLDDGQNRVGDGSLSPGEYCITSDGSITDGKGRGCILTPPTTQFQCDEGATPTPGFSVDSSGKLEYKGSTEFFSCETGQNGGKNIYTSTNSDQTGCKPIELHADSCAAPPPSPPPSPPSPAPSSSPSPPPSKECGTTLSEGNYEFPHLIVPVDSEHPDTAYGTQYNGTVTSTKASIFNFDIPQSDSGKKCSLVFLFPKKEDLETSSYSFSGDGKLDFAMLSEVASTKTTYNNMPSVAHDYGVTTVSPGNSYMISTFDCPAGTAVSYEIKNAGSTELNYFQDYNPSPLGLYITVC